MDTQRTLNDALREIDQLKRKVEDLEHAKSIIQTESIRRLVLEDVLLADDLDTTLTDLNQTTTIGVGGGSVSHMKQANKRLILDIDGTKIAIGARTI